MLPSKGYFKSLNCPFYLSGFCIRPHCHFRHSKRDKSGGDVSPEEIGVEDEIYEGVLREGLNSVLSESHPEENSLLIDNEDGKSWMSQQSASASVSYKPTPIAELRKRHIPVITAPIVTHSNRRRIEYDVKTRKPKVEYVPESLNTNQIINSVHSPRSPTERFPERMGSLKYSNQVYKATKISETPEHHQVGSDIEDAEESEDDIDFDQVSSELNFLDEILKEYENKPDISETSEINIVKLNNDVMQNKQEIRNGFFEKQRSLPNKENTSALIKVDQSINKSLEKFEETGDSRKMTFSSKSADHSNNIAVNKSIHWSSNKNSSSKPLAHKGENKNISIDAKRNSKEQPKSENEKCKTKSIPHSTPSFDGKTVRCVLDSKDNLDKTLLNEFRNVADSDRRKKSHGSSSSKSSKHNKKHKTSKSSQKDSSLISQEHKSKSNKSSKKDLDHRNASIKSKREDQSSSMKQSKRELVDESTNSKKKRLSSPENNRGFQQTEMKSSHRSKPLETVSSGADKNLKRKHQTKQTKNSNKSCGNESSLNTSHRTRKKDEENIKRNSDSKKRRVEVESKNSDETDDDVEIISDAESIIVIDSEEETNSVEVETNNNKSRRGELSPSLSRSPSPIFPSDESSETDQNENSDTRDASIHSTTCTSSKVQDDTMLLDHRVQARIKKRTSLGEAWRPELRKRVPLLTPANRLLLFRKSIEKEEKESEKEKGCVRIGSVPNVQSLLEEKRRLLVKMKSTKFGEPVRPEPVRPQPARRQLTEEDKDKVPALIKMKHSKGADENTRQRYMKSLYEVVRNLVKPNDTFKTVKAECQKKESEMWLATNVNSYEKEMRKAIAEKQLLIQNFTLKYFLHIKPLEPVMIPVSGAGLKGNKETPKELAFYDALQPHILSEEQLETEGYPRKLMDAERSDLARINTESQQRWKRPAALPPSGELACVNCSKFYRVDDKGLSLDPNGCTYHAKKKWSYKAKRSDEKIYSCCSSIRPCMSSQFHSTESADSSRLEGFVETSEPTGPKPPHGWGVFGVDCEMLWTVTGLALGRVTVVGPDSRIVYDTPVRPSALVTDYCTRMSGLTEDIVFQTNVDIKKVQKDLLSLFNSKTILIGHSLENDLRALKIIHNSVVDTALVFIGRDSKKRPLKDLASELLQESIQNAEDGHNSAEDAITCMKLMLLKAKKEAAKQGKPVPAPLIKPRYRSRYPPKEL